MGKSTHCTNGIYTKTIVIVLVLSIGLLIPDFWMNPGTDYGVYFNGGRLILQGKMPYRDFWDHKTPLIYFYTAIWQFIFGSNWWSAKSSLIPIYAFYGISIYILSITLFPRRESVALLSSLSGVYLALRLGFDPARNGVIIALSTSLEVCAASVIYSSNLFFRRENQSNGRSGHWWVLGIVAGIISAMAFLARQTSVAPVIIMIILALLQFSKAIRINGRSMPLFVAGYAVTLGGVTGITLCNGVTTTDLIRQTIEFNRIYAAYYVYHFDRFALMHWLMILGGNAFWWYVALAGILLLRYIPSHITRGLIYAYIWLGVTLILTVGSIKPQSYYRLQYLPYLLVVSTALLVALFDKVRIVDPGGDRRQITAVLVSIALVLIGQVIWMVIDDSRAISKWYSTAKFYRFDVARFPDMQVSNTIRNTTTEKEIFVNGNRAWIYVFANKTSPVKYYYSAGIFAKDYLSNQEFNSTMQELVKNPPPLIVYERGAPRQHQSFYNAAYIATLSYFVGSRYHVCDRFSFTRTWPYSPYKVEIYCLNELYPSK